MPITRKQFELGIDTKTIHWMKRIHLFLAENKDKAYTNDEIKQNFEVPLDALTGQADRSLINEALDKLTELRAISSQIIRGDAYYCYAAELPAIPTF